MPNPDLFNARQAYFDDVIPTLDGASHVAGDVLGGLLTFNFRIHHSTGGDGTGRYSACD